VSIDGGEGAPPSGKLSEAWRIKAKSRTETNFEKVSRNEEKKGINGRIKGGGEGGGGGGVLWVGVFVCGVFFGRWWGGAGFVVRGGLGGGGRWLVVVWVGRGGVRGCGGGVVCGLRGGGGGVAAGDTPPKLGSFIYMLPSSAPVSIGGSRQRNWVRRKDRPQSAWTCDTS